MKLSTQNITPHPKNREIYSLSDLEDLKSSIQEVGLLQPLILNQFNQILSGHRRFECIKDLGWEEVEVDIKEINDEETELYLVHFNKQRIKSIKEVLNEYDVIEKFYDNKRGKIKNVRTNNHEKKYNRRDRIAEEIGVKSSQLGKLLFIRKNNEDHIELIDKGILTINQSYLQIQRESKEKVSREGDQRKDSISTVTKSKWRFYQKSSHDMSELKDGEVQTIFTSPPYWNKRTYLEGGGLGNEPNPNQFIENLSNHLKECYRVLNERGSFFLNIGDTFLNGCLQNIPFKVSESLKEQGWILRNTIIWSKTNPKPSSSKSNLTPSYEYIFHFVKSMEYDYYPTLAPLSDKTKPSLPPRHRSVNGEYSDTVSPYIPNTKGKNMGDYWNEDIVRSAVANQKLNIEGEHPAPFPQQIVLLPILQTSKEFELVLDPFMGSGTVGRVCDEVNRNFVGYDLKKYF